MVVHRVLSLAFVGAQRLLAADADGQAAAAAAVPASSFDALVAAPSLLHVSGSISNASSSGGFSWHALFGADQCHPAEWERTAGVTIAIILILYLCIVLTRVCDQHLIPALEVLSKKWGLSEDVAGVTLLAFGGSFPELAIHTIATLEGSEIGVGTVIGSAVFNVTVGLAVVAVLAPFPMLLFAGPLLRDSAVYVACLSLILIFFNWNARVVWWQALLMLVLYIAFVTTLIVRYRMRVEADLFSPEAASPEPPGSPKITSSRRELASEAASIAALPRVEIGHATLDVAAVRPAMHGMDEPASPDSPSRSAAMAAAGSEGAAGRRGSVSHRKNGSRSGGGGGGGLDGHGGDESDGEENEHAGLLSRNSGGGGGNGSGGGGIGADLGPQAPPRRSRVVLHDYSDEPNPGWVQYLYYQVNRPTDRLNAWLIPNCTLPGRHKYYRRAFTLSLLVVLLMSFVLMCLVQYGGCVSGIDSAVTGLLVLGAAASLPDVISVGVSARRGLGVMAVSGLVGSNVFDVLVGLGVPWLLHMGIHGGSVALKSGKVYIGSLLAVVSVVVFGLSILVNGMRLQRHVAWLPLLMYVVYVICVVQKVAPPPEDPSNPTAF